MQADGAIHCFGNGFAHAMILKNKVSYKVENRRPNYSLERG